MRLLRQQPVKHVVCANCELPPAGRNSMRCPFCGKSGVCIVEVE